MKHVGKLVIFGALLKAVKTSCVRTMQGRTYLRKHRLFGWLLLRTYYKIARVVELQLNMEWYKLWALGSNWTLLPKNSEFSPPSLPPPRSCCWSAWWENLHAFNNILLFVGTDLSYSISLKASFSMWNPLSLYLENSPKKIRALIG